MKVKVALLFDGLSLPPKDGVTYRFSHLAKRLTKSKDIEAYIYLTDRRWTTPEAMEDEGLFPELIKPSLLYNQPHLIGRRMADAGINILTLAFRLIMDTLLADQASHMKTLDDLGGRYLNSRSRNTWFTALQGAAYLRQLI